MFDVATQSCQPSAFGFIQPLSCIVLPLFIVFLQLWSVLIHHTLRKIRNSNEELITEKDAARVRAGAKSL